MTTPPPQTRPSWWLHWLTLALAAAGWIAGAIHPGYSLPPVVAAATSVAAFALAAVSTAATIWHAHGLALRTGLPALRDWTLQHISTLEDGLDSVRATAAKTDPAVVGRIADIEAAIRALLPPSTAAQTAASAAPAAPSAAGSAQGAPTTSGAAPGAPTGA